MIDPRPGWYPDPGGSSDAAPPGFRWWDGSGWTDEVSDSADAPTPQPRGAQVSRLRTVLVLTLGFTLFVTASVGVGLVLWRDSTGSGSSRSPASVAPSPDPTVAVPTSSPSPSASGATGQLNLRTRVATIGAASMTLPDDPYDVKRDPKSAADLFDLVFMADATVHEDGFRGRDWAAMVALGRLSDSVGGGRDLTTRGRLAMKRVSVALYGGLQTKVTDLSSTDVSVGGCRAKRISADVHYTSAGLPSRYDSLSVIVVQLRDGSVVVAMSAVPDDAGAEMTALATASLDSLAVS